MSIFGKKFNAENAAAVDYYQRLDWAAGDLLAVIEEDVSIGKDSRRQALAKTKLEEAVMWAQKAVE